MLPASPAGIHPPVRIKTPQSPCDPWSLPPNTRPSTWTCGTRCLRCRRSLPSGWARCTACVPERRCGQARWLGAGCWGASQRACGSRAAGRGLATASARRLNKQSTDCHLRLHPPRLWAAPRRWLRRRHTHWGRRPPRSATRYVQCLLGSGYRPACCTALECPAAGLSEQSGLTRRPHGCASALLLLRCR